MSSRQEKGGAAQDAQNPCEAQHLTCEAIDKSEAHPARGYPINPSHQQSSIFRLAGPSPATLPEFPNRLPHIPETCRRAKVEDPGKRTLVHRTCSETLSIITFEVRCYRSSSTVATGYQRYRASPSLTCSETLKLQSTRPGRVH